MFTVNCILYWKTKKWKKRPGIANFFLFTQLPFDKPKAYQEVVYSHKIEMKWSKEYDLGYHILHIYDKLVIKTLLRLFLSFQTNITIFKQINVKNIHPVYGAGIQTHNLRNMSLLP